MLLIAFGVAIVRRWPRIGAVTGKGLTDLIRENFGVRWTLIAVIAFLIAASSTIVANFASIGAALAFFGIPRSISPCRSSPPSSVLVVRGSYTAVERAFLAMSLVFLGYIASAFLARPDWSAVASGLPPRLQTDSGYILLLVALIGTLRSRRICSSSCSPPSPRRGIRMRDCPLERLDVYLGSFFACAIATFIIITTGATLHREGIAIESAADAAMGVTPARRPLRHRALFHWPLRRVDARHRECYPWRPRMPSARHSASSEASRAPSKRRPFSPGSSRC